LICGSTGLTAPDVAQQYPGVLSFIHSQLARALEASDAQLAADNTGALAARVQDRRAAVIHPLLLLLARLRVPADGPSPSEQAAPSSHRVLDEADELSVMPGLQQLVGKCAAHPIFPVRLVAAQALVSVTPSGARLSHLSTLVDSVSGLLNVCSRSNINRVEGTLLQCSALLRKCCADMQSTRTELYSMLHDLRSDEIKRSVDAQSQHLQLRLTGVTADLSSSPHKETTEAASASPLPAGIATAVCQWLSDMERDLELGV